MLIEIHESVCESLKNAEIRKTSSLVMSLNKLADSFYEGNHLIVAELMDCDFLAQNTLLNETTRKIFRALADRCTFWNFEEVTRTGMVLHVGEIEKEKELFYWDIGINQCDFHKSVLLSENLDDCSFYDALSKYLHKKSTYLTLSEISLRFVFCGGSQPQKTSENELKQGSFVLLIMDSDKNFADDSLGTSAKDAIKAEAKFLDEIFMLYILNVHEKENLIPPSFYLLCSNPNHGTQLLKDLSKYETDEKYAEYLKFLDLKGGIKKSKFDSLPESYTAFLSKLDSVNLDVKSDESIIPKIGSHLVDNFQHEILEGGNLIKLENAKKRSCNEESVKRLESKVNESSLIYTKLPNYLKDEWGQIYQKVLLFGCCLCIQEREQIATFIDS